MVAAARPSDPLLDEAMRIYTSRLQSTLEPGHNGEYLVLNVDTGEYELDHDDFTASRRASERFGNARLVTLRVGQAAAYRLGGISRRPAC